MRLASGLRVTREGQPTRPVRGHSVPTDASSAGDGEKQTRKRILRDTSPSSSACSALAQKDDPARGRRATSEEEVAHGRARSAHLEQEIAGYDRRVGELEAQRPRLQQQGARFAALAQHGEDRK